MASIYSKPKKSSIARSFNAWMPINANEGYSSVQDDSQQTALALYADNSIGKMLVDSLCRFVIGKGLVPMASPESKILGWTEDQIATFQQQAEAYWRMNSGSELDFFGKNSFCELQKIAFKDICNNGDTLLHIGHRKTDTDVIPFVQIISGRMIAQNYEEDTKNSVGGVIYTKGRESGYKIRVLSDNFIDEGKVRIVNRYNKLGKLQFDLIQLCQAQPNLARGVPLLTALRDEILSINKYKDNHLAQSAIETMFTAFIKHDQEPTTNIADKFKDVAEAVDDDQVLEMGLGNIVSLDPGEDVVFTPRGNRSDDFEPYIKSCIGLAASALGMSYETAMNTYNASFSASRAGISGTEKNADIIRQEFIRKFCQPVWEMVIEDGIIRGYVTAPGYDGSNFMRKAVFASSWTGVTPPQVDLTKEVNAFKLAVESGLCSRSYAIKMLFGLDSDEVDDQRAREIKNEEEKGLVQEPVETSDNDTDTDSDTDAEEGDDSNE